MWTQDAIIRRARCGNWRIKAESGQLQEVGMRRCGFEGSFYGQPFKDDELSRIYLYQEPVEIEDLTLQKDEVSEVIWMDYAECREIGLCRVP